MKRDNQPAPATSARANLPDEGFVRLTSILAPDGPIPISRSSWWEGVRTGRYPKPVKLGPRTTCWRVEDVRALIEKPEMREGGDA